MLIRRSIKKLKKRINGLIMPSMRHNGIGSGRDIFETY